MVTLQFSYNSYVRLSGPYGVGGGGGGSSGWEGPERKQKMQSHDGAIKSGSGSQRCIARHDSAVPNHEPAVQQMCDVAHQWTHRTKGQSIS